MKLIDNHLFLEFDEMIEAGVSGSYLSKAKSTGTKCWQFIDDPADKRKVLIGYDKLKDTYKQQVQKRFGNPYDYIGKEPIKKLVETDFKADEFYMQYRYDGKSLPIDHVGKYVKAASWLNMLNKLNADKKFIKKQLNLSLEQFFTHVCDIIKTDNIELPGTYQRLRNRMAEYAEKGYECLVDWRFGNKNSIKVSDDVAETQLLSLIEDPRNFDDVLVCVFYNKWASVNNYKEIQPATVAYWRRKKEAEITIGRKGSSAFNEKFIRQVKGLMPSVPLALVEHDDNNLDFLFKDETGYQFHKYVALVIIDSRTKLVLGKSVILGIKPQQWQVEHAYLDAMYYIRSLTGGWHLPFEMKCDKWAHTALEPVYDRMGMKRITPSHGNKHRGYIEPFFGSPLWKRAQQIVSKDNWSGNNITAKHRGVNMEALKDNSKFRPMIGAEAEKQIEQFFYVLRHMPDFTRENIDNKQSREQKFLEEWSKLTDEHKRPIDDEQFLLRFGIKHTPKHTTGITITNRGIEPQISNTQYSYDLPDPAMYNTMVGRKVEVIYDPFDMSRILVTNNQDIRFIARTAELSPRALKDTYTGSRTFLNNTLENKKQQVKEVADKSAARQRTVDRRHYNAEALLQGGAMIKEIKNTAEHKLLEDFNQQHESFIDDNNDFNDFFN